jgi:diguanylate cyclase (GGDEF)-like protein
MSDFVTKRSKPVLLTMGVAMIALVGVGDYFATSELLEFSVFFLLPVSFFTWFLGTRWGIAASLASGISIAGVNHRSPTYLSHNQIAYWNALLWMLLFVLISFIVAHLKKLHRRERQLARVDTLTSAATRLAFYESAGDEINRARRLRQPVTLAYLDLDSFKEVNDRNGHSVGDSVLVEVARGLQANIRQTDMLARMGGDEFVLLLPNTHSQAANTLLQKVSRVLTRAMQQNDWPVTFSIGAVTFLNPPESVDYMVQRTDEIMYIVKKNGKNHIRQEEIAS